MEYYIGSVMCFDNYLQHYGVKGMKWGVRKADNTNGASNHRFRKVLGAKKKPTHDDVMNSNNPRFIYKNRKLLSDKEFQQKIDRINNEKKMKDMLPEQKVINKIKNGKDSTIRVLNKSADVVIGATVTALGIWAAKKILSQVAPDSAQYLKLPKK